MWNVIGRTWILILTLTLFSGPLMSWAADDIRLEATVNSTTVSLEDVIEFKLTVYNSKDNIDPVQLPLIDGFDARFVGPATRYMIINGVSSSERSLIYNLFPSKAGRFQLPSVSMTIEGKVYQTSPIDIDVVEKSQGAALADAAEADLQQSINDKVFMTAALEPKEVYVGQKTPLVMKVFVNGLSLQLAGTPYLKPDGFTADSTANMQKSREVLNGISYDSLRFDTNIYPSRPGMLKVGPFTAQGELIYRVRESNDIFGDFFGRTQSRPITLTAPAVEIKVLPLPEEGRPADFSGAVGNYDFKVSVTPLSVKVGDPLTVKMTISKEGSFKRLTFPKIGDSRFKTYEPQIKEEENAAFLEQVIIPTSKEVNQIPAVSFSYFDPLDKTYKMITQGPFNIEVTEVSSQDEFKAYGFIDKSGSQEQKTAALNFQGLGGFLMRGIGQITEVFKNIFFWIALVAVVLLIVAWRVFNIFRQRLKDDERFARQWKADARAKEHLNKAKGLLNAQGAKDFYASLYKALNDYLADKVHLPAASLTWPVIEAVLKERLADEAKTENLQKLFERCDMVRFASVDVSLEERARDLSFAEDILNYLSKILK